MNKILEELTTSKKGHYCHAVEMESKYDLENLADVVCRDFGEKYGKEEVVDFLETLEMYALDEDKEEEIFSFSFADYVEEHWEDYDYDN